jgi:hypothetical protein
VPPFLARQSSVSSYCNPVSRGYMISLSGGQSYHPGTSIDDHLTYPVRTKMKGPCRFAIGSPHRQNVVALGKHRDFHCRMTQPPRHRAEIPPITFFLHLSAQLLQSSRQIALFAFKVSTCYGQISNFITTFARTIEESRRCH